MPAARTSSESRPRYLTVDIGGTKTAVAVAEDDAQIADRTEFSTTGPEATIAHIIDIGKGLIARQAVEAIGISCGGPLNSRAGIILGPPNLAGWDRVPIVESLSRGLDRPAFLENDANAGALAEWVYGAARGYDNIIFLTCGTGLGAGIILDGRLYRGKQDLAGEIGHIRMERDGPIGYFKAGSLEGFASGGGLAQLAGLRLAQPHETSALDAIDPLKLAARNVGELALGGDRLAIEIVSVAGTYLGKGLAILIDMLNPECIVLGALAVRLGDLLLGPMRREVQAEALKPAREHCDIVPAQLGERIGDVAALCAARYNLDKND